MERCCQVLGCRAEDCAAGAQKGVGAEGRKGGFFGVLFALSCGHVFIVLIFFSAFAIMPPRGFVDQSIQRMKVEKVDTIGVLSS